MSAPLRKADIRRREVTRWLRFISRRNSKSASCSLSPASVIEADASRYHGKPPGDIDWSLPERQTRAAAEFLGGLEDEDPDASRKLPKAISQGPGACSSRSFASFAQGKATCATHPIQCRESEAVARTY